MLLVDRVKAALALLLAKSMATIIATPKATPRMSRKL
jgi:hypothetical protein